jgi:amidohydrolase
MAAVAESPAVDLKEIVALRHDLHAHPELMYREERTSQVVQRALQDSGIAFVSGLAGGTGVLGWLPATVATPAGKALTVALRADMDALPITEGTGKPYASKNPGVMHACGHDGHTAVLLGVARALAKTERRPNNVLLVFQPAEEGGAGGKRMVEDGVLDGSLIGAPADCIFGLHGWTTLPLGHVATRSGPMMAATNTFTIVIRGQGGHAASPHLGIDPILVAGHLITALQGIASRNVNPFDQIVITVGQVSAGTAVNIIPHTATILGTVRTMLPDTRLLAERRVKDTAAGIAAAFGATADVSWEDGYPVTSNAPEAVERFMTCASRAKNGTGAPGLEGLRAPASVSDAGLPTMGAEDFSYYGPSCPACFFQLGLIPEGEGAYPSVHTPEFDFNDDAIPIGMRVFLEIALSQQD